MRRFAQGANDLASTVLDEIRRLDPVRDHQRIVLLPYETNMAAEEWNAGSYDRVSDPQYAWGQRVLGRLPLRGDETVLDAGCGTGRLTEHLLERLPHGQVIAVDLSGNMLRVARENLAARCGTRAQFLRADLQDLPLEQAVDAIFSTASFHWVPDHDRLFRSLFRALKPGGRLVAQCGGGPNLARLLRRAEALMESERFIAHYLGWNGPWEFADDRTTERRLANAGFDEIGTSLEEAPTVLPDAATYCEFLATVILRLHLERLPDPDLRDTFLDQLTDAASRDRPPFRIDYWRLNIEARRPE